MNLSVPQSFARSVVRGVSSRWRRGNVVMFHGGRCGSTVLGQMLGDTRGLLWMGELYDDAVRHGELPLASDPGAHLRFLEARMKMAGSRYFGFEVRFLHLEALRVAVPDWLTTLDGFGFEHFLVLERRNHLRALVSAQIAVRGGPFHLSTHATPVRRSTTLELVRRTSRGREVFLVDRLRRREEQYANLKRSLEARNVLWLTYEVDLEQDVRVGYRRICAFLGLTPTQDAPRLGRTNPFALSELIENFAEVQEALEGSPYMWMLEDSRPPVG